MTQRTTGRYERTTVGGEEVAAFVPRALPPAEPPLVLDGALLGSLRAAEQALIRLELAGEMVPSLDWFIYAFVRKEAVLSSQIEGTQRPSSTCSRSRLERMLAQIRTHRRTLTSKRFATTSKHSSTHALSSPIREASRSGCAS